MAFGDVFAGWMDAAHQHQQNLLQMEYQNKKQLAEQYAKLADDPRYDEASVKEFMRRAMEIPTLEPGKKLPKEYQNFTIQVQPPTGPPVRLPGSQTPGAPISSGPGPVPELGKVGKETSLESLQGMQPTAGVEIPPQQVQPPAPAPHDLFAQMPFEQQIERMKQQSLAKGASAQEIAGMKAAEWKRQTDFARDMPDGKRHKFVVETRRDPDTGQMESRQVDQGDIANFAPRMGNVLTLEDAKTAQNLGFSVKDSLGKDLDIDAMIAVEGPYATIQNKGNYYEPMSVRRVITSANNITQFRNPYAPEEPGAAIGQTRPNITTTTYRETGVDAQGHRLYEPFDAVRRVATGPVTATLPSGATVIPAAPTAPTAPAQQPAPKPAPWSQTAPTQVAPPVAPPVGGNVPAPVPPRNPNVRVGVGISPGTQRFVTQVMLSARPAATILYGDSKNPDFESLQEFASVADDAKRRDLVGNAARVIIRKMGNTGTVAPDVALRGFGASANTGGILKVLTNYLGLPGAQASSETKVVEDALKPLTRKEVRMVGRIMAAYGTIVGLRRITGGIGSQFLTETMEREIPIPGMTGVNSSQSYYNKLASLGEEITKATEQLPREMVPEYPFWERNTAFLNAMGRGWPVNKNKAGDYAFQHEDGQWYDTHGQLMK